MIETKPVSLASLAESDPQPMEVEDQTSSAPEQMQTHDSNPPPPPPPRRPQAQHVEMKQPPPTSHPLSSTVCCLGFMLWC